MKAPKGRQSIARGVSPWTVAESPESATGAKVIWAHGHCRPVWACGATHAPLHGLTPLAINCRPVVAFVFGLEGDAVRGKVHFCSHLDEDRRLCRGRHPCQREPLLFFSRCSADLPPASPRTNPTPKPKRKS